MLAATPPATTTTPCPVTAAGILGGILGKLIEPYLETITLLQDLKDLGEAAVDKHNRGDNVIMR